MNSTELLTSRYWAVSLNVLRAVRAGKMVALPDVWAARGATRSAGDVAVVPVMGVLTQRGGWFGMSVESIRANLRTAVADPNVKAIVFEYDSPGGEVSGIEELATEMRQARSAKPTVAVANSMAASAAYYLAAQASEVLVTPSGEIGSVGVYAAHEDWSRALDQLGVTVTLVSAGEGKVDGNMFEPLTDEVRADMQMDIDRYYQMFTSAVAKGRGVAVDQVRNEWKAKVYGAKEAVSIGMADAVGTLDDAIRRANSISQDRKATAAAVDRDVEFRTRARRLNV